MQKQKHDCGCSFDIVGKLPNGQDAIAFDPDVANINHSINFNCEATWDLISKGLVLGCWQIEKFNGVKYSKMLKPENLEHLSALGAVLRPGTLRSKDDKDISFTDHYCLRKNNQEPVTYFHECLKDILEPTFGQIIYQEQITKIAEKVGGFNLTEADALRKAIGKKLPHLMAESRKLFIEKANKIGMMKPEELEQLFNWIEQSQKYLFNKSHSYPYGIITYVTAYIKQHFPLAFYLCWLTYAKDKPESMDEVKNLVKDAKIFDIEIFPPAIEFLEPNFHSDGKHVYFGITNIKGIGDSQYNKLKTLLKDVEMKGLEWIDLLLASDDISSTAMRALIQSGTLCKFNVQRQQMLQEYEIWRWLTDKEKTVIYRVYEHEFQFNCGFIQLLEKLLQEPKGVTSIRRNKIESELMLLKNPPCSTEDTIDYIISKERELLGIALTCNKIDNVENNRANTTCKELLCDKLYKGIVCVELTGVKEITIKKGANAGGKMGFLKVDDGSAGYGDLEVVVFANQWANYYERLIEGDRMYLELCLTDKGSYRLENVWEI